MEGLHIDYLADSVYSIPITFYKNKQKKIIICDLDNTLLPYKCNQPSKKLYELVERLKENSIKLVIISNNKKKKVSYIASKLKVEYISFAIKPLTFKLKSYIKKKHLKKEDIIYIGDQIFKDMIIANTTKIDKILTNPLSNKMHLSNHLFMPIEKMLNKHLKKKNMLGIHIDVEKEQQYVI